MNGDYRKYEKAYEMQKASGAMRNASSPSLPFLGYAMLEVRRASLVRQMAFRQDSNDTELAIRHGHLAPPNSIPDSPRPQKPSNEHPLANTSSLSVDVPMPKSAPSYSSSKEKKDGNTK
uniref:Uncharacterized protein n=1 Tax=Caenorhabditis japonica TaxID=281687 RepID=A0A8R1DUY3_CAEJA